MNAPAALRILVDDYERRARLYPVLIVGTPLVVVAIGVYGVSTETKSAVWALVGGLGVIYLLSNFARAMGKRIEESLYLQWGGKPTTQLLRHRDRTVESPTKSRYHQILGKRIEHRFPTPEEELADPFGADEIYASSVTWLVDNTRDREKFSLLYGELVAYGFLRNSLGLKPIAIAVAILSILWILGASDVITTSGINLPALIAVPMPVRVAIGINLTLLVAWTFILTKKTVKAAAFTYAAQLLRASERL